jgi:urease accessory protein
MTALRVNETALESRRVEADLHFARSGQRSFLRKQYVPYPFHITRPFQLDPALPHLTTLYLQSASGGLYRDDRLALSLVCESEAAAHVTTQAATIVHDTKGRPALQETRLVVAERAFLAFTPDPTVLFSGAHLTTEIKVTLAAGATIFLADAYSWHDPGHDFRRDPRQAERPFERLETSVITRSAEGQQLAVDRGALTGVEALAGTSPLGNYRAVGSFFILGEHAGMFDATELQQQLGVNGCLAGVSKLPAGAGQIIRLLAPDGGILRRGLETTFAAVFTQFFGTPPARRRK